MIIKSPLFFFNLFMGISTLVPIRNVSIQSDEFFGAVHIYDFLLTNVLYLIYIYIAASK